MNYCPSLGQTNNQQQFWERRNQVDMDTRGQHATLPAQKELSLPHKGQKTTIARPGDLRTSQQSLQHPHHLCKNVASSLGGGGDEDQVLEVNTSMDARSLAFEGATEEAHRKRLMQICEARETLDRSTMIDPNSGTRMNELMPPSVTDPTKGMVRNGRYSSSPPSQAGGQVWVGGAVKVSGADVSAHRLHYPKTPHMNQGRPTHPAPQAHMASTPGKQVIQAAPSVPNIPPGPHAAPQSCQGQNPGLYMANVPSSHINWNGSNVGLGPRFPSNQGYPRSQASAGHKPFPNQALQSWDGGHPSKMNFPPMHIDAFGRAVTSSIAGVLPVAQSNVVLPGTHNQQLLGPHMPNPYLAPFMNGQMPPAPCYSQLMTQAAVFGVPLQPQLMVNLQAARSLTMMASEHQLQQQKSLFKLPHIGSVAGAQQVPAHGQVSRVGKFSSKMRKSVSPLKPDQLTATRKTPEGNNAPLIVSTMDVDMEKASAGPQSIDLTQKEPSQGYSAGNEIDLSESPVKAVSACDERSHLEKDVFRSDSLAHFPSLTNENDAHTIENLCARAANKPNSNEGAPVDSVQAPINVHALTKTQAASHSPQAVQRSGTIALVQAGDNRDARIHGSKEGRDQMLNLQVKDHRKTILEPDKDKGECFIDPSLHQKQCDFGDVPILNAESNDSINRNHLQNEEITVLVEEFKDHKMMEAYEAPGPVQNGTVQNCSSGEPNTVDGAENVNMPKSHTGSMFPTKPVHAQKFKVKDSAEEKLEQSLAEGAACENRFDINRCLDEDDFRSRDHSFTGTDQSGTDFPTTQLDLVMNDTIRGNGPFNGQQYSLAQLMGSRRKQDLSQSACANPDRSTGSFPGNYLQGDHPPNGPNKQDHKVHVQYDQYPKTRLCILGIPESRKTKSKCPKLASFGLPKDGALLCSVNSTVGSTVVCCLADSQQVEDPENLLSAMGSMVTVPVSLDSCVEELQSEIRSTRGLGSEASSSIKSPGACSTQVYETKARTQDRMEEQELHNGDMCQMRALYDPTSMEDVQYDKQTRHPPPIMDDIQTSKRIKVYNMSGDHPIPTSTPGFAGLVDVPVISASEEDALVRNVVPCSARVHAFDTTVVCSLRTSKRQGLDTVFMSTPVLQSIKSTVCAVVGFDYEDSAILCWAGAGGQSTDSSGSHQLADDQLIAVPVEEVPCIT